MATEAPISWAFEGDFVLNAATVAVERWNLIGRAELVLQSIFCAWQKLQTAGRREISHAHTSHTSGSLTECQDDQTDLAVSHGRTTRHRDRDALEFHRSAAVKVDSAEYAFTMMLAELRSVMETPPTTWKPTRNSLPEYKQIVATYAVCAA